MGIGEIISKSFKYPLGDKQNFKYAALIGLLVGLTIAGIVTVLECVWYLYGSITAESLLNIQFLYINSRSILIYSGKPLLILYYIILGIGALFTFIFALIFPGYLISVMKEGIGQSDAVPKFEVVKNVVDTIKLAILGVCYMIVPSIIAVLFMGIALMVGGGDSTVALILLLFAILVSTIVFVLFEILFIVAQMRFAKYGSLSEAFSLAEVWQDLKQIGIIRFIVVIIVLNIIVEIIMGIGVAVALIPLIGGLVFGALILPFALLAYYYALGTLYSEIA